MLRLILDLPVASLPASLPLIGHTAIYTLNLIVLGAVLSAGGFVDENPLTALNWDNLVHFWRSWFLLEDLANLTEISNRNMNHMYLKSGNRFDTLTTRNKPDSLSNISKVLSEQAYKLYAIRYGIGYDYLDVQAEIFQNGSAQVTRNVNVEAFSSLGNLETTLLIPERFNEESNDGDVLGLAKSESLTGDSFY